MSIECGATSDVGRVRTNNEDSFAVDCENNIYIVADGMGGHSSGEVASKMATELIMNNIKLLMRQKGCSPSRALDSSIVLANQAIFEASRQYPKNHGMGTTVVSVLVTDKLFTLGWVGDSRIYLVRHGAIQQLSTDHSLVQEQMVRGLITPEQAETSEYKNVLTRALGAEETVTPQIEEIPSFDQDYIILCSDGLTRMVTDEKILETVKEQKIPDLISKKLVELANEAGGRDNVTAVVIQKKSGSIWDRLLNIVSKL